jgi:hypothetical protein
LADFLSLSRGKMHWLKTAVAMVGTGEAMAGAMAAGTEAEMGVETGVEMGEMAVGTEGAMGVGTAEAIMAKDVRATRKPAADPAQMLHPTR